MSITPTAVDALEGVGRAPDAIGRIAVRLLPFLFVLYVFNYLDRINIGFAALSMNRDLGLSATAFGLANTVFYVGYVACEIPSNLLMARYGARVWLSRIMITWGLASAATMLVVDTTSLLGVRFLVGVLEAGFVPGVLLYLTYWFPERYRARANGRLMMAQPLAMALGAGMSGFIIEGTNGWLGVQGWRWMFLIEGLPAVLLGIAAYYYLTDRPQEAAWLSDDEKGAVSRLIAPPPSRPARPRASVWRQLLDARIVLLSLSYFCLVNTINANATWIPTIVRSIMQTYSLHSVGLVSAIPAVCALAAMPFWVASSDRRGERRWHVVIPMGSAAVGWLLVVLAGEPAVQLFGLVLTTAGAFCAMSTFWTLPQSILSAEARPAGIGLISAVGLLGSALSPAVIGVLRDLTGGFAAGLLYVAALLLAAIAMILIVCRLNADRASVGPEVSPGVGPEVGPERSPA